MTILAMAGGETSYHPAPMRRRAAGILAVLTALVVLPACTAGSPYRTVTVAKNVTVALPGSSSLAVTAAPAPASAANSIKTPIQTSTGGEASPLVLVGEPWLLRANGPLPVGGVTLTFTINPLAGTDGSPFLASFNPSTRVWTPVASRYDSTSHTVSATVPHFSIWGVLSFVTSGLDDLVTGALDSLVGSVKLEGPVPSCSGNNVTVTVTPNDGTINACGQDADARHVVVELASTLAFPIDVEAVSGSAISLVPPGDIYADIDRAIYDATKGNWTGTVVPAGSEADVTLAIAPGESGTMKTELDDIAYLTGIIYSGVQVLLLAEKEFGATAANETVDEINRSTCAAELAALPATVSLNAQELRQLATVGFECAEQVVHLGVTGDMAAVAGIIAALFENIVQTAFLAVETAVGWSTGGVHQITVSRRSASSFSSFVGTWNIPDEGITITASGAGTYQLPDYPQCPTCTVAGLPINVITFQLNSVQGSEAVGTITSSTDAAGINKVSGALIPEAYQVGSTITLTLGSQSGVSQLQVATSGGASDQLVSCPLCA
jgi:hypothetical protein